MRYVTIATASQEQASAGKDRQVITIPMEGGSPWYAYVWINNECYIVRKRGKYPTVSRVKD